MAPNIYAGVSGFGNSPKLTVTIGGGTIGGAMETLTSALSSAGRALDKRAAMVAQQCGFKRRSDDWQFQVDLATELTQMYKQTMAAKTRKSMTEADLEAHNKSIDASAQMDAYMNKGTNTRTRSYMTGASNALAAFTLARTTWPLPTSLRQTGPRSLLLNMVTLTICTRNFLPTNTSLMISTKWRQHIWI
jgi:hypothetical protein